MASRYQYLNQASYAASESGRSVAPPPYGGGGGGDDSISESGIYHSAGPAEVNRDEAETELSNRANLLHVLRRSMMTNDVFARVPVTTAEMRNVIEEQRAKDRDIYEKITGSTSDRKARERGWQRFAIKSVMRDIKEVNDHSERLQRGLDLPHLPAGTTNLIKKIISISLIPTDQPVLAISSLKFPSGRLCQRIHEFRSSSKYAQGLNIPTIVPYTTASGAGRWDNPKVGDTTNVFVTRMTILHQRSPFPNRLGIRFYVADPTTENPIVSYLPEMNEIDSTDGCSYHYIMPGNCLDSWETKAAPVAYRSTETIHGDLAYEFPYLTPRLESLIEGLSIHKNDVLVPLTHIIARWYFNNLAEFRQLPQPKFSNGIPYDDVLIGPLPLEIVLPPKIVGMICREILRTAEVQIPVVDLSHLSYDVTVLDTGIYENYAGYSAMIHQDLEISKSTKSVKSFVAGSLKVELQYMFRSLVPYDHRLVEQYAAYAGSDQEMPMGMFAPHTISLPPGITETETNNRLYGNTSKGSLFMDGGIEYLTGLASGTTPSKGS